MNWKTEYSIRDHISSKYFNSISHLLTSRVSLLQVLGPVERSSAGTDLPQNLCVSHCKTGASLAKAYPFPSVRMRF